MSKKHWLDSVAEMFGYHFEPAHPTDCECYEYGTNTTRDGYWHGAGFVSKTAILDTIRAKLPEAYDWSTDPKDEWENADWVGFNRCLKAIKEALLEEK